MAMFPLEDVKFRVLRDAGPNWLVITPYVDARRVLARLRDQYGGDVRISLGDPVRTTNDKQERVAIKATIDVIDGVYEDYGEHTEPLSDKAGNISDKITKSAASDAIKRAAVHLGIGTEFYEYETVMGRDILIKSSLLKDGKYWTDDATTECRKLWSAYMQKVSTGGTSPGSKTTDTAVVASAPPVAPPVEDPFAGLAVSKEDLTAIRDKHGLSAEHQITIWQLAQTGASREEVDTLAASLVSVVEEVTKTFDGQETIPGSQVVF